jgi:hypothetical protein
MLSGPGVFIIWPETSQILKTGLIPCKKYYGDMGKENKKNGYAYSKQWFEFISETKEMVRPIHTALYFWIVELNNRAQWEDVFGLPTDYSMKSIRIKGRQHYKKALDDLIKWGFVKLISKSPNQHISNQVSLCLPDTLSNKQKNLPDTLSNTSLIPKVSTSDTKGINQVGLPDTLSNTYKTKEQTILNFFKSFKSENLNMLFITFLKIQEEENHGPLSEVRVKALVQNLNDVAKTDYDKVASINQSIGGRYRIFKVVQDRIKGITEQESERKNHT